MVNRDNDEEDVQIEECVICGGDIVVDEFCEEEDMVYCNDCETEFLIRSLDPLRLEPMDIDPDDDIDALDDRYDEDYS
ncbi:hypothetical protein [Desulfobulbus oligotrophicus]|jgi:lysine biosynthesis protein LysW|uniref:Lysine biosynthesis protein LysW n=1 Tax=Desulfobulbus oligotrophicus TaxID=1909699 RepID=A0A7T5VEH4_9BACT|nr:hypothetical protein [Desulfobulbus oligotrophicus]MDY0390231.1 hypothetical protein [Desulfobulbus oligotrophicus]QQG66272.1 hypothetical protein HP555_10565 [Desulfobulbus oligotrophicus]